MYARILEMKTKKGQARALCAAAEQKILPIVRRYPGLVDVMWMIPDESPDSVLAVSWWQTSEAADKFRTEGYSAVADIYRPFVEGEIRVRKCEITVAPSSQARVAKAP
ncbi:MAG TPA: antibiotic biosynthesis monooxygenase [Patescibacteria group bacterium]|nr:antibiotic biosynthesis monooxygenase [Patescibacteria group bacterium]